MASGPTYYVGNFLDESCFICPPPTPFFSFTLTLVSFVDDHVIPVIPDMPLSTMPYRHILLFQGVLMKRVLKSVKLFSQELLSKQP